MKTALILNFTGNGYHFGCFGTAREIYAQLQDKGYLVNYLTVKISHATLVVPKKLSDFSSREFVNKYIANNNAIYSSIIESDIVVVNGEGTLHRLGKGPIHLLFMMHLAKVVMRKPTYLINHSCFPVLDGKDHTKVYAKVLKSLDGVVAREQLTQKLYDDSGVNSELGFDSLPLYIDRVGLHDLRKSRENSGKIVIAGGINYAGEAIKSLSRAMNDLDKSISFQFLLGGKQDLAKDEIPIFEAYRKAGLIVELVEAETFEQWITTIATARGLISARFHYSIAALAVGAPVISLPSNTPKVEAIHKLLEHEGAFSWQDASDLSSAKAMTDGLLEGAYDVSDAVQQKVRALAAVNYRVIPAA